MEALVAVAWLLPLVYVATMTFGHYARHPSRQPCALLIIQITTIGNQETVNEIIAELRGYNLPFPYEIWVVTEPGQDGYIGSDRTEIVPEDFACKGAYKARALEYSRRLRFEKGLCGDDVKVLFLDDDSLPTENYVIETALADFDVCEGIVAPRRTYGRFLSHMDDLRTFNCLTLCSAFQGHGFPLWVHGEGLCVRASAEQIVTWDYPMFASEDFVFGHMAAKQGLHWGFVHEYVCITSPWRWKDFLRQRRRWLWGNLHAIRYIVPWPVKLLLAGKYLLGIGSFVVATAGMGLDLSGVLDFPMHLRAVLVVGLFAWLTLFALSGWTNSDGRAKHALIAALLAWVTSAVNVGVLLIALFQGNPRRFDVIEKTGPRLPEKTSV